MFSPWFASRFAALLLLLLAIPAAEARTRPRAGGSITISLRDSVTDLDPALTKDSLAFRQQIAPVVFETLTRIDEQGNVRPLLAASVTRVHATRWSIALRKGVRFSDGSEVDTEALAEFLSDKLPGAKVRPNVDSIVIDTPSAWDALPQMLSLQRFAISKQVEDGWIGTGPYVVSEFEPGQRALLTRNGNYWGAAPYMERIEVRFDREAAAVVRSADLAELTLEQAESKSVPSVLYALKWLPNGRLDPRVREAMSLVIARESLVLPYAKSGTVPAYSYLPQNVSGYAFLFQTKTDAGRARSLVRDAGWKSPLSIAYRANDPVARMIAERVAVNAREAGLVIQAFSDRNPETSSASAAVVSTPIASSDPGAALFDLASALGLDPSDILESADAEHLLAVERELLNDLHALPLVHVPAVLSRSRRLHDVAEPKWHLETAWADRVSAQ
jgi:peptide/nickel transport system substrate-binding protein